MAFPRQGLNRFKLGEKVEDLTLSHSICNRLVVLLRHMFNTAIKWEIADVTENPTANYSINQSVVF
jgi:hypothetical protein